VLTSVQEQTGLPEGLAASSHYSYDLNGNLIGDTGKGITQIDYNLLNLPVKVTGQGGGILEFEYTFGGEKIRKNNEHEREYVGGLEYKNNVLELIHFPNGRIDKTGTVDTFQYYLTDHLGNIVVLFQDTDGDGAIALEEETNGAMDEVIQRNYYYSFGLRVDSPDFQIGDEPKNRYLYNGKELNEELDLNWLDYGFRWYDPAVGRFPSVDPLANITPHLTPYHFVSGNPISRIDPLGLTDYEINKEGKISKVKGTETEEGDDRLIRGKAKYKKNGELKGNEGSKFMNVDKEVFDDLHSDETAQYFKMTSAADAENLFEFIVAYVDNEFAKADLILGNGKKESFFLTTYSNRTVRGMTNYLEGRKDNDPDLMLVSLIHNHPNTGDKNMVGSYGPSGEPGGETGDIPQAEYLDTVFKGQETKPKYFIWRHHIRTPYDGNGIIDK
jgi:RHS repeat-associated protein